MSEPEEVLSNLITEVFSPIYQAVIGVTILYFLYGVMKYVFDLNNPEKQTFGRSHLLWGSVGLFIVFTVGGVLGMFENIFGSMFK